MFVSFTFGMGLVSAVAPLAAQAFGARDPRMVRRALRVGLWAALLGAADDRASVRGEILIALGQAPASAHLAQQYLFGLAWGILPALWFIAIRGFMGAVNRPEPVLWITLAAIPANALLVYPLIHGKWGLPGSGCSAPASRPPSSISGRSSPGCGSPRAAGRSANITCSAASGGSTGPDGQARRRRRADLGRVPAGIRLVRRGGLLMGLIGTTALAAHQIALQIAAILYMVPFGISMAATVRVGHAVGRRDAAASGALATSRSARHRVHGGDDARRHPRPTRLPSVSSAGRPDGAPPSPSSPRCCS